MSNLINYINFLERLMVRIDQYFDFQAPYIMCKKGCAKCCTNGDYPFSEVEVELLKQGFSRLDDSVKKQIIQNIAKIKNEKLLHDSKDGDFLYPCPFLINNQCSVYNYRGIICRTFGLISLKSGEKMQIPFCAYEGLNYSNVLDKDKGMLMADKMKELGLTIEPKAYNIHYSFLTSDEMAKDFGFSYGRKASLIDLLQNDSDFTE